VGDSNVGKTCLLSRFLDKQFKQDHDTTIGVDFGSKIININMNNELNIPIKLQIWDTAGQERFKSIIRSYYKGSIGVILVYDISDKTSFDHVKDWLGEINKYTNYDIVIQLIGNKSDLGNRKVSFEEGLSFAQENNLLFMETTAKNCLIKNSDSSYNMNINSIFHNMTIEIYKKILNNHNLINNQNGIIIGNNKQNQTKCCTLL